MARVRLDNVSKTFRGPRGEAVPALQRLSLAVEHRELLVVVGPSGSGKTTLLRLIAGLEEPDSGRISLDDQPMEGLPPAARDVAMVFQHQALYPHLTVYENLALGLRLRRLPRAVIRERVQQAAAWLGLGECLARRPHELSGGQRQRVALGRALVRRPKVFLLDEPFAHLDPPLRVQMQTELRRLHSSLEATMIVVTHDQAEALSLGQRVAVLHQGALQQVAAPETLYQQPANLFVAGFIGWPPINLLRGALRQEAGRVCLQLTAQSPNQHTASQRLELPAEVQAPLAHRAGREVVLGLRPEHIRLVTGQPPASDAAWLAGTVNWLERLGPDAWVYLSVAGQPLVARWSGNAAPPSGGRVWVELDLGRAGYFDPDTGQSIPVAQG